MTILLTILALLGVAGIGAFAASVLMLLFGSHVAVLFAAHRADEDDCDDESLHPHHRDNGDEDDEVSRLDALAIQALIRAASRIAINENGWKVLPRPDLDAFSSALLTAEDRFADWIEWAEQATDTKIALAPAGTDA